MLDTQLRKDFGLRLRALRKHQHWTLKELAAKLNILSSQLNKYECGINLPPPEKLLEMADLFHTSIDFLLTGEPASDIPLHNQRLLDRFLLLQSFPSDDQETIIKLIDAFIFKNRVQDSLSRLDNSPILNKPQKSSFTKQLSLPDHLSNPDKFKHSKSSKLSKHSKQHKSS